VYARRAGGRTLTFDFAAGLVDDNLLLADRETDSIWSQLEGRAIDGPLEGEPLTTVPSLQTTWGHWRQLHPDTEVMVLPDAKGRPYLYRTWIPGQPRAKERPTEHDASSLGLGLVIDGEAIYFPFSGLAGTAGGAVEASVGGQSITIHYQHDALTAWAEDADGVLLDGVLTYRWAWDRFFPASRVWVSDESVPKPATGVS
jgi:hypothetical protein